jgi:Asp-tRNA(Asn)/Glu-tRNA(Gln) amidotransferase A subunit family amidase
MDEALQREADRIRHADRFGGFVAIRPDAPSRDGRPLGGAWLAVKDNIGVAGLPFTAGIPMFRDRLASEDAEVVTRMRDAGARVAGVTHTDAGGFGVTTPAVRNPVSPETTVGGSSGGSAAVVAAGIADIGLGTDTGGSIRIPAACCGLYAFKPTHGRVPMQGVWPMAPRFDHVGVMTRGFDALAAAASVLLQAPMRSTSSTTSASTHLPRFGVDRARIERLAPAVLRSFVAMLDRIEQAGIVVDDIRLPDREEVRDVHGVLTIAEAKALYANRFPMTPADLGELPYRALSMATRLDRRSIDAAERQAAQIVEDCRRIFDHVDVIIGPTLAVAPPSAQERKVLLGGAMVPTVSALIAETCLANVIGSPALVLPFRLPGEGLASIQLMTGRDGDAALFALGARLVHIFAAQMREAGTHLANVST